MSSEFLTVTDRIGTACEKWDDIPAGVLPLWVADMDFACAPAIVKALKARAAHPIYGYSFMTQEDYAAVLSFYKDRHGLCLSKEDLLFSPSVVHTLRLCVLALTKPGDKVLYQPPVYGPFRRLTAQTGRVPVENELKFTGSTWEMDLSDLEKKLPGCKVMLLCSPHNPGGRVWSKSDLQQVLRLCKQNGTILVADEIHCDFVYEGFTHTPVLTLDGADEGVISAVSATKTFNIAGLQHSTILCRDERLRKALAAEAELIGMGHGNIFGVAATTAAYSEGRTWLDELMRVLAGNREYAYQRLTAMGIPAYKPEGTYLMLADFRSLAPTCEEINTLLLKKGKVMLCKGTDYGTQGEGFMRVNLAAPRALLQKGMDLIETVVRNKG